MTAHAHAELCRSLRCSAWTEDRGAADVIDSLHAQLVAMAAERDLYRESTEALRDSATLFRLALERDRRSIARLLADVTTPTPPGATGAEKE